MTAFPIFEPGFRLIDGSELNDAFAQLNSVELQIAASDETTQLVTGTGVVTFRSPLAFALTAVRGSLSIAGLTTTTVDIKLNGVTVLQTLLRIDGGTTTSLDATVPPVVATANIPDDGEFTVDIVAAGTSGAGLKVTLLGSRL